MALKVYSFEERRRPAKIAVTIDGDPVRGILNGFAIMVPVYAMVGALFALLRK
jgi:hypothetical protein